MSDFGCLLIFKKTSGELSQSDKEIITIKLEEIIPDSIYSIMIQDGDYTDFYGWEENVECVRLTEYYNDGDEELYDFAKEEDLPDAEEIAQILQDTLNNDIEVTAIFSDW